VSTYKVRTSIAVSNDPDGNTFAIEQIAGARYGGER
jgi:hypothetical protein